MEWLRGLLQSYPGSRWGNRETRGLDSDFAEQTYVETPLEAALLDDLRARRVRLVVLCGNAGDGKTALLQHLARQFGLERRASSERVLEGETDDGLRVRMNLDGSASWRGRSADDLLDEFLAPFRHGPPAEDIAHLLAINDGRLLEWIERVERHESETALTRALYETLQRVQQDRWAGAPAAAARDEGDEYNDEASDGAGGEVAKKEVEDGGAVGEDAALRAASDAHIRFVNLNQAVARRWRDRQRDRHRDRFPGQSGRSPVRLQTFEISALLPVVFYMFRYGYRRGAGKFLATYGPPTGTPAQKRRQTTVDRITAKLAKTDGLAGFAGDVERAILGDLLLCFCLKNVRHRLGRDQQVQRVAPTHYMASWIDLPWNVSNLRYGFHVDTAPPGMTVSNEALGRNRAALARRLRDLGLLVGVNDAERMKRLTPRFEAAAGI